MNVNFLQVPEAQQAEESKPEDETAPMEEGGANGQEPAAAEDEEFDEQQGEFQVMDSIGGDSEAPEADQKMDEG